MTDPDYMHAKRVCREFEITKLIKYHDWHLKTNALLLADNF